MDVIVRPEQIEYILLTIRWMESRETYDIPPNKGGASGAYQYIKKTWANYAGYPEAYLAPPWVQDERAAADVAAILRRYDNDVSVVPIIWYYPAALADPTLMDVVPKPEAGNVLTIREYQWRWLDTLAYFMGGPLPPRLYALPPGLELLSGIPPVIPAAAPTARSSLAFPLLGPAAVAPPPPCDGEACDEPEPGDRVRPQASARARRRRRRGDIGRVRGREHRTGRDDDHRHRRHQLPLRRVQRRQSRHRRRGCAARVAAHRAGPRSEPRFAPAR